MFIRNKGVDRKEGKEREGEIEKFLFGCWELLFPLSLARPA